MKNDAAEALKIYQALQPMIRREIAEQTKSCVRAAKMTVTVVPADGQIGVAEAYGDTLMVPCSSALEGVAVGQDVWVVWLMGNMSTMVALWPGTVV